jgi:hypothetical protein
MASKKAESAKIIFFFDENDMTTDEIIQSITDRNYRIYTDMKIMVEQEGACEGGTVVVWGIEDIGTIATNPKYVSVSKKST